MPISVVGVAGPGDALANPETLEFFRIIDKKFPDLIKCMSTNGLLLADMAEEVAEANVSTITVTVNAIDPEIGKKIYSRAIYDGKVYEGEEAFKIISQKQLEGIEKVAKLGVVVKVNSVLVPGPVSYTHLDVYKRQIEVPSGIRGRMAIFGPIIDEADAIIIMEDAPYGFGCIGCARTNELTMYFLRKKGVPILELHYPETREETMEMVNKINTFLDKLTESTKPNEEQGE